MMRESDNPAISVIITVFNSEKTLQRCLISIASQSFQDFEVICINDGSCDGSLSILENYARKDNRFRVISQPNKGVAMARQAALDASKGTFSIHVDSDDWIEPDMLEGMINVAQSEDADLVICDFLKEWPDKKEIISQKPRELDSAIILGQMFSELHGSLCNKLIRNATILHLGIKFEEGLNSCEDQLFVMRLLSSPIKVSYINKPYYHYIINTGQQSITQNWFRTPVSQRLLFIKNAEKLVNTDYQIDCFKEYVARIAYDATRSDKEFCPSFRQAFFDYWPQIKRASIPLYRKVIIWLALIGIRIPR